MSRLHPFSIPKTAAPSRQEGGSMGERFQAPAGYRTGYSGALMPARRVYCAFVVAMILAVSMPRAATVLAQSRPADITVDRIARAKAEPQNWATYFGTYDAWRYSSLDQINTSNVKNLTPVWAIQTGKIDGGLNATPLVVDGVMYLIASEDRVFALNAATGERLWSYDYRVPRDLAIPYGKFNRGLAVGYGMVFFGTMDNHVVALDAGTGRESWNVEVEEVQKCGCNITGAPILVKDKVVVGSTGGDSAHRGYITAFYAKTGRLAW